MLTVQSLLRRKMCELGFDIRYKSLKVLGKGATAEVFLVERISDKKLFAAKIISIKDANDKSYVSSI
jgi:serine/threonine protein kinase